MGHVQQGYKFAPQQWALVHRNDTEAAAYPSAFEMVRALSWDFIVQVPGVSNMLLLPPQLAFSKVRWNLAMCTEVGAYFVTASCGSF